MDFIYSSQQRSATTPTKDSRLLNMMVEVLPSHSKADTRVVIKSRAGLATGYTHAAGVARGAYYWTFNNIGYSFAVIDGSVYVNGVLRKSLTTSVGMVGFTEHVNDIGVVTLFMCDGVNGYIWTTPISGPTLITDVNFPTPHIPSPIFLDSYIFLAKTNTEDIYNSAVNDPLNWSDSGGSSMYISAEIYPDNIKTLAKNNNYIYAVGSTSIEYFYDAANLTGSPLARQESAVQQFGTAAPFSVVMTEKEVILVGQTGAGGKTVWTIDGFKEHEIGTTAIRSILDLEGESLIHAIGSSVRISTQKFYILKLTNRTLVYSFDTEMWSEWASGVNNSTNFIGTFLVDGPNGAASVLTSDGTNMALMSEAYFTDLGTEICCQVITPKYDYNTTNRKFMPSFTLIGDVPDASDVSNSFSIEWSDNDYRTWSLPRTLTFNYDYPTIKQLGEFRRRAFRITYSSPHLVRLDGIEVDLNKGSQ